MTAALAGKHVVVSAGPTYEDIDPVRFIGNRSSGKMGFALALAASRRGAEESEVAGPGHQDTPHGVVRNHVRSAAQQHDAVLAALPADVYIGAAAVADFAPRRVAPAKIKKSAGGDEGLVLELVRTADVLADVAMHRLRPALVVGFAAETEDVARHARDKLQRKRVDMIVANRVGVPGAGFEGDDNAVVVHWHDGERALGPASKQDIAEGILDLVVERLRGGAA